MRAASKPRRPVRRNALTMWDQGRRASCIKQAALADGAGGGRNRTLAAPAGERAA
jgi:hypothetical protein